MNKEKFKNFFYSNGVFYTALILVFIFGLFFRLWCLYKPEGLWFDELCSYDDAIQSFPFGIIEKLNLKTAHTPLFYFSLHIWMKTFGTTDIAMRLLSVLFGFLTIPLAYLTGKNFSSKGFGLAIAGIIAVNSLSIFYSQEVRFYSLISCLTFFILLFAVKSIKKPSRINFSLLAFGNLAMLYTFFITPAFVFFELSLLAIYFYLKKKEHLKDFIIIQSIGLLFYLPYIPLLIKSLQPKSEYFLSSVNPFAVDNILSIFHNIFSPVLYNLYQPGYEYWKYLSTLELTTLIFFVVLPAIIYITGTIKTLLKKDCSLIFFIIGVSFLVVEIMASMMGKMNLLPRYCLIPIFIIIFTSVYGLTLFKKRIISVFLISYLVLSNGFYLFTSPSSASIQSRVGGYKNLSTFLQKDFFNEKDYIIMPFGHSVLYKYYTKKNKPRLFPFEIYNIRALNDKRFYETNNTDNIDLSVKENQIEFARKFISSKEMTKPFKHEIQSEIIDTVESERYVILVLAPHAKNTLTYENLQKAASIKDFANKIEPFWLMKEKMLLDIKTLLLKHFTVEKVLDIDTWKIVIFKKK